MMNERVEKASIRTLVEMVADNITQNTQQMELGEGMSGTFIARAPIELPAEVEALSISEKRQLGFAVCAFIASMQEVQDKLMAAGKLPIPEDEWIPM